MSNVSWDVFIPLWDQCRKIAAVLSDGEYSGIGGEFPRRHKIAGRGTVSSVTNDTTIVLSAVNVVTGASITYANSQWREFGGNGPQFWDLIIDYAGTNSDPASFPHVFIQNNTGNTLTVDSLTPWLTYLNIASLSDLAGKNFYIIPSQSSEGGLWWSFRIPMWVAARTQLKSTVTAGSTTSTLSDSAATWTDDQWNGKDLIVSDGSNLRRVQIVDTVARVGAAAGYLTFATQSWTPATSSEYRIIAHGEKWHPDPPAQSLLWYGDAALYTGGNTGRKPDGTSAAMLVPITSVNVTTWDFAFSVVDTTATASFDKDVWSPNDDDPPAASPQKCYTPGVFRSLRGVQFWLEDNCVNFFSPSLVINGKARAFQLRNMTVPEAFDEAGLHYESGTVSSGQFTPSFEPGNGTYLWYSIIDTTTNVVSVSSTRVLWTGGAISVSTDHNDETWQVTACWTRKFYKGFRYMFDRAARVAGDEVTAATYPLRPKSTRYSELSDNSFYRAGPFTAADDGKTSFTTGDLARYLGDSWTCGALGSTYDNFHTGVLADRSILSGTATDGGSFWLADSEQAWDVSQDSSSGTATGSTTTLADSGKSGDIRWVAGRFTGPSSGWGFVIRIQDTLGNWHRRVIDSHPDHTSVGFSPALSFSASGRPYIIHEYKDLSRWKGRTLNLREPDGTLHSVTITGSDDTHLFFAAQSFTVAAGWTYTIDEPVVGYTYKKVATGYGWEIPSGTDSRVSAAFPADPKHIPPDYLERHGRQQRGDIIGPWLKTEIEDLQGALYKTLEDYDWWSDDGVTTPQTNDHELLTSYTDADGQYLPGGSPSADLEESLNLAWDNWETYWSSEVDDTAVNDAAPLSLIEYHDEQTMFESVIYASGEMENEHARYAFGKIASHNRGYGYTAQCYVTATVSGEELSDQETLPGGLTIERWEFDARGTGLVEDQWKPVGGSVSFAASGNPSYKYTSQVGTDAQPPLGTILSAPTPASEGDSTAAVVYCGFEVMEWKAVLTWDI